MAFIVRLCCICIVPFLCYLSPGTSLSTHSGCITQQSNPDCEGLLAQPKGQGRLYGWQTLRCVNSAFVPYAYANYRLGPNTIVSDKSIPTNQKILLLIMTLFPSSSEVIVMQCGDRNLCIHNRATVSFP